MKRSRLAAFAGIGVLLIATMLTGALRTSAVAHAQATPSLRFVQAKGYALSVAGKGWPAQAFVTFVARVENKVAGIVVQPTRSGAFTIGINQLRICDRPVFDARNGALHAVLRGPELGCASQINPPVPVLTVVKGRAVKPHTVSAKAQPGSSYTLHVGDTLLLDAGSGVMSYIPSVDTKYLVLVPGIAPVRMVCPSDGPTCAGPSFWKLLAIRAGNTEITMSPLCGRSTPPCAAPDYAIAIHILPAVHAHH